MSKIECFAYYKQWGNPGEPLIKILRKRSLDNGDIYATTSADRDVVSAFAGELLDIEMMAPDTYMLTNPPGKRNPLARAVLVHAAFRNEAMSQVKTLATTIPADDEVTIAEFEAIGFSGGWGKTRSEDELIMINTGNTSVTRLATAALQRVSIRALDRPPLQDEMLRGVHEI